MSCCCSNTLDFCTQNVCGEIDFDILATNNGVYVMQTEFLGVQVVISKYFLAGDSIIFPLNLLNESYQYTANIFNPNGTQISIPKSGVEYDCFKFKTILNVAV